MKEIIKKVPVPLSGVMLGTATLGNLLQSYSEGIRYFCGIVAAVMFIMIVLKLVMFPDMIKKDLETPIQASVAATFPMGLMLLSAYIKPFVGDIAFIIWIAAIILHVVIIIYFTLKFIIKLQLKNVFASYYIVYVGIAAAAVSAPAYGRTDIGGATFWFGFVAFIILFVLVSMRYLKLSELPDPAKPLICIYAAPASLCLAGYIQSVSEKSYTLMIALLIVATVLWIFALVKAVGYVLKFKFFPSFASFTFPFAVSAVAAKQTMAALMNMGSPIAGLSYLVMIETVAAVIFILYTIIKFAEFLFVKK